MTNELIAHVTRAELSSLEAELLNLDFVQASLRGAAFIERLAAEGRVTGDLKIWRECVRLRIPAPEVELRLVD